MTKNYKLMTEGKIYPLLWKMAIPSIIGIIVISLYSLADTFFISLLGKPYLISAIGIVFSFVAVIQGIGFWFGYGAGNYISIKIGEQNDNEAEIMASTGFYLSIIVGFFILVLGFVFLNNLAIWLGAGASELLLSAVKKYLSIALVSVPFMLSTNLIYNILRLSGSPNNAVIGVLFAIILNIILDPVFIFYFKMGIRGAAIASLLSQIIGFMILYYCTTKKDNIGILVSKISFNKFYIKKILIGGLPNFSRQLIEAISLVILNHIAVSFGEYVLAAMTISLRIIMIIYAFAIGFGQGFQPICAMNYGAKKYDRIKKAFNYSLLTISVYLIIMSGLVLLNIDTVFSIFTSDKNVRLLGIRILRLKLLVLPFMGVYILIGMLLQNIGEFFKSTVIKISENGIFLIPIVLILSNVWGLDGFILSMPIASICALVFSVYGGLQWKSLL